jgi:hypothetical protein
MNMTVYMYQTHRASALQSHKLFEPQGFLYKHIFADIITSLRFGGVIGQHLVDCLELTLDLFKLSKILFEHSAQTLLAFFVFSGGNSELSLNVMINFE